jgi:hypothetical protein
MPIPQAVAHPEARLRLRVGFSDATGRRWLREGNSLSLLESREQTPTKAELCYSRALELFEQDPLASGVRGNLLQALTEQATEQLRGPRSAATIQYSDAPRRLTKTNGRTWDMKDEYTDKRSGGPATIAGAFTYLNEVVEFASENGTSTLPQSSAMSVPDLISHVCSILTAMAGLERQPRRPDEDDD